MTHALTLRMTITRGLRTHPTMPFAGLEEQTDMIRDLIMSNRSCRRFREESAVERKTLEELVDLARLSASGANRQPLKFMLSWEPQRNALVFPYLGWAGYLKDWSGPEEGERPRRISSSWATRR